METFNCNKALLLLALGEPNRAYSVLESVPPGRLRDSAATYSAIALSAWTAWRAQNIRYIESQLNKSQIYLECEPLFARGLVRLPDHPTLLRELRLLERQAHRGGRESVDHPRGQHDDYANAVCLVLRTLASYFSFDLQRMLADGREDQQSESERNQAWRQQRS